MSAAPSLQPRDALDELAAVSRRLADLIAAISRRSDVRATRAKILVLIAARRCPRGARQLRQQWYVRGAAARFGADRIAAEWPGRFGEPAPSIRTIRKHLGDLEQACALARAPGDWMPVVKDPEHPERRPRYPDTLVLLETDREASWWASVGADLRRRNPDTRCNPDRWRMVFGSWRRRVELDEAADVGPLFAWAAQEAASGDSPAAPPQVRRGAAESAHELAAAVARGDDAFDLQRALAQCGARLGGANSFRAAANPRRLAGAAALLALALGRDDGDPRRRIRNRAGWLWRAFRFASEDEIEQARRAVLAAVRRNVAGATPTQDPGAGGERRGETRRERGPARSRVGGRDRPCPA